MLESELHPAHFDAWRTAQTEKTAAIHGATIQGLSVGISPYHASLPARCDPNAELHEPAAVAPPLDGFTLTGTLDVFGIQGLNARFYSHHAPAPSDLPEGVLPIHQLAVIDQAVSVSTFFPEFSNTALDVIKLRGTNITYQNYSVDRTKAPGWHIGATIDFDKSCDLNTTHDWHAPLTIPSFAIEGVFTETLIRPCTGLTLNRIGARIIGYDAFKLGPMGALKSEKAYSFGAFGRLNMNVPSRVVPLDFDFEVRQAHDSYILSAHLAHPWDHAFGIPSLILNDFSISVSFHQGHDWESLVFEAEVTLDLGETVITLEGTISVTGEFLFTAVVADFSWVDICSIYNHLFGANLTPLDMDIHFGMVTVSISSDLGFTLNLHELQVGDFVAVDGLLEMKSNGAVINAAIAGRILELGDFTLEEASVIISFSRECDNSDTNLMLNGKFKWLDYTVSVGAHLYKSPDSEDLQYSLYGTFTDIGSREGFCLADHVPGLEHTCLKDISLVGAAIVVASRDDAELGSLAHCPYPVRKGVQICAGLRNCGPLSKLSGTVDPPLILSLAWSGNGELDITILANAPIPLNLGPGVVTDSASFHIVLGTVPKLKLKTGAKIAVNGSEKPLHFMIEVELDELGGTLTGHLAGGWNNPFDISPQLTVGPNLLLTASILYAGVPSGLGFVGGLQVGKSNGQVAFQVSEHPSKQIFSVEVQNVDLLDVVHLTRSIIQCDLPDPSNVIQFHAMKIYVCPVAVQLSTISYPQGFSFSCHAVLFDKHVDVDVVIQKTGARLKGSMDSLKLGPLVVSGNKTARPFFDIEISPSKQAGTIDGRIEIFGISTSVYCKFQLAPKFSFEFDFELSFAELFEFEVHAGPSKRNSEHDSSTLIPQDYSLTASFHQKGRGRIGHKIDQMFHAMARKEREDAEVTQKRLEAERIEWERKITCAQAELDAAHIAWETKSKAAHSHYDEKDRETKANLAQLRHELDEASRKLHDEVARAQANLWAKQHEREAAINADEDALRRTRQEWDDKINGAHHDLDEATRVMHSSFGGAQADIDEAIRKVNSLQGEINHVNHRIWECENGSFWDHAAIPGLFIERSGLEVARGVAEGALNVAKAVVEAGDFVACKGAMETAQLALTVAQAGAGPAIGLAIDALEATKATTREFVETAEKALSVAQTLGDAAVAVARKALEEGENAAVEIMRAAHAVLDELSSCGEWIEYQAKKAALETAKVAGSGALSVAKAGVAAGEEVVQAALVVGHWVIDFFTSMVVITELELSLELGQTTVFDAYIKGNMKGDEFEFKLHLDPSNAMKLIEDIFDELVESFKKNTLKTLEIEP
ncbi:hypothetical protein RhiLY_12456 [Ceratobasidium sp. AG-Ba]|nr:hypothetical protein RhiLY_12456 [Ceratobasidium sp. AG-Ba]